MKKQLEQNNKTINNLIDLLIEFSGNSKEEVLDYSNLQEGKMQLLYNQFYSEKFVYLDAESTSKMEIKTTSNDAVERQKEYDFLKLKYILNHNNKMFIGVNDLGYQFENYLSDLGTLIYIENEIPYEVCYELLYISENNTTEFYNFSLEFVKSALFDGGVNFEKFSRWELFGIYNNNSKLLDFVIMYANDFVKNEIDIKLQEAKGSI